MSASYHSDTPASDPNCPLALQTRLASSDAQTLYDCLVIGHLSCP